MNRKKMTLFNYVNGVFLLLLVIVCILPMGALCCHYCSTIFVYAILNHQNVAKTFRSLYNMDIIEGKGGLDR